MNLTARIATLFRSSGSAQSDSGRFAAMPAVFRGSNGTGAPSSGRLRTTLGLLAISLVALFATAAPAAITA